MKNFLILVTLLAVVSLLISCNTMIDENADFTLLETKAIDLTPEDAQREFAIILSKAVCENSSLRHFIQDEALKEFDNDLDVFYPLLKDKKVDGHRSFRDVILSYTSEQRLSSIENALPLLTIFMPNLSFTKGFNVHTWDADEKEVAVSYMLGNRYSTFYFNGDSVTSLKKMEIPCFPYMVVKNNERLKVSPSSRVGESGVSYELIDDVFNPEKSKRPKTRTSDFGDYVNVEMIDSQYIESTASIVRSNELDPRVCMAYSLAANVDGGQRDFIYYGINDNITGGTPGQLHRNYGEKLFKFRFVSNLCYDDITDAGFTDNLDPVLADEDHGNFLSNRTNPVPDSILAEYFSDVWTSGNFEFLIQVKQGNDDGTVSSLSKIIDVPPYMLFQVGSVHYYHDEGSLWTHSHYQYKLFPEDLLPKWVNVDEVADDPLFIMPGEWDLMSKSLRLLVTIEEIDPSRTYQQAITISNEYADKRDFSLNATLNEYIKTSAGISLTETTKNTSTTTISYSDGNDHLGEDVVKYYDKILLSRAGPTSLGNVQKFNIKTYNTGRVKFMIVPACTDDI